MNPSDKETRAIFLNFKEVRSLERNRQALDNEKAYYISLINLDQKIVKVHYKRLKDKVSKIRSHLKPDELDEIKFLDESGNLPKRPMSSKLDSNLKIQAAERRLKLMPRAKSAVPRLMSRQTTVDDSCITPRSARVVRTNIRPLTSPAGRSNTSLKTQISVRSARSASSRSSRKLTSSRTLSSERADDEGCSSSPVPISIRRERKNSIYIDTNDLNKSVNHFAISTETSPRLNNMLTIRRTSSIGSRSNISMDRKGGGSANPVENPSAKCNVDINIELVNDSQTGGNPETCPDNVFVKERKLSPTIQVESNTNETPPSRRKSFSRNNGTSEGSVTAVPSNTSTSSVIEKSHESGVEILAVPSGGAVSTDKYHETKVETLAGRSVDTLNIPSATSPRPMSVPTTKITDCSQKQANGRPQTSIQRALETRNQSVMNIRRASAMLAEGKTRTPFNCHEVSDNDKKEKPFRSIRYSVVASTDIDKEILDSNIGDDLHKEIKKGMLLGEVATSLYLEDKIDHFLDKVDTYVKENPNYTYDPEITKAELLQKAREAKNKKPKRNRLRRRQLERQLQETDLDEMRKSRWLRADNDELDMSGVNTLVVDQMKMLSRLKYSYDSD